jgi:ABC-type antimicrobial peptide transport system permease subunit
VREFENKLTRFGYAPLPLREIVDKNFTDVNKSTRYLASQSNFKREDDLFPSNLTYVDPEFFELFTFDFLAGNPASLKDKSSVFVSEEMAIRLFRTPEDALGKTIKQVYGNELKEVKIGGIFHEPPMNSSLCKLNGSAYMNFENVKDEYKGILEDDWKKESTLFLQVEDASRVGVVQWQLQPYTENNNKVREDFHIKEFVLDPFITMAHQDRADNVRASTWAAPPLAAIIGSTIMSILILLIACFNLTNTAIAISSRRLKEIGIRKVMGSMRAQLIMQFIGETTSICLLGILVGVGLSEIFIEGWNRMTMGMLRLTPHYFDDPSFLLFLLVVLLFTGVLAGSYPAFYISKFNPINILKGKLTFGGTNYFTRILLGLQFAITLISIVSAIGFLQNARYQRDYDLGFDIRGSVIVALNNQAEFDTYRNALRDNSEIVSVAGAKSGIFSNPAHEPISHESRQAEVDIIDIGDNYLKTMDLKLLEGRDFIKDSETDKKESVIITERMADLFNWDKPLGKEILWRDTVKLFVIGVVKDVYTMGLWREMEPMMIRYVLPVDYRQIVVSAKDDVVPAVNNYMSKRWSELFPNRLYPGRMLVSDLHEINSWNINIMYMYAFLGLIAMTLSATGLFTLVSLNVIKRTKEIGVRKVLGASVLNISRLVNTEFFIILTAASLIGSWASFGWVNTILGSIWKYYQGANIWTFLMGIGILFSVSLLTIGYKVFSVATMNPVTSLRDE